MIVVENYKNSGKTKYTIKFDTAGFDKWKVNFIMEIPLFSYAQNNTIESVIYPENLSNKMYNKAFNQDDDGVYSENQELWNDINNDGITSDKLDYSSTQLPSIPDISSLLVGLSMWVEGSEDTNYSYNGSKTPGQEYKYKMVYSSPNDADTSGFILYNNFEDINNPEWEGTFENLDVSDIIAKGGEPEVYYSTQSNLDPINNITHDISNSNIWTKTMPNKDDIKAVAVDVTKKPDGSNFIINKKEMISIVINMKAPNEKLHTSKINASNGLYKVVLLIGDESIEFKNSLNNIKNTLTANQYQIIFDNNFSPEEKTTQVVDVDVETALDINEISRDGYIFKGWSNEPNGEVEYT